MKLDFFPEPGTIGWPNDDSSSRKLKELVSYKPRPYSSLEVELTTRCNLYCPSCPRVIYRHSWIEQDMTLENFHKISPAFDSFESIHFRGWGEPVLNPFFPEMVRLAYQSGARLVLSTNGTELLNLGLLPYFEAIIFRLDYGLASIYERRNPAARFNRVIFNISQVLYWREVNQSSRPLVIILFAKDRYSLPSLPIFMDTAIRLNPDRVVFYQPFFHVRPVDEQAQLPGDADPVFIQQIDRTLEFIAESAGLKMVNRPVENDPAGRCVYDSQKSAFVNWCGQVGLCRNSSLPVAGGRFSRFFRGKERELETAVFGSLLTNSLDTIFQDRAYRRFSRACRLESSRFPRPESQEKPPPLNRLGAKGKNNLYVLGDNRFKSCFCDRR